ncbi:recombinase RecA [candidate division WOR-3 bacterium]|nr:recombinase RecA [candidate division WOR-3 bacterium]MCK4527931.1 recombinase RecA [candidate division WOR-3 bacterium]
MDEEKKKALDSAMKRIQKQYGDGAVMKLGSKKIANIPVIPTGSLSLDYALGIGGIPRGRAIEIFGKEASGKTTLALHIASEAQKMGGAVAFIDAEHALDPKYAKALGIDTEELIISQPDTGEEALEIAEMLVRSGAVAVIVIDSVAALVPKAEIEGEMGDAHMGLRARLMSQALRKLSGVMNKSSTSAVFLNQVRYKIGIQFGNPMTTPGGLALKFHTSVRLEIKYIGAIKEGTEQVGMRTKVKVVKNKLAPPFKEAEFDIMFGKGISKEGELLDIGQSLGLIEKSGSWFTYGDTNIGQGRENSKRFFIENPDLSKELEEKIREKLNMENGQDNEDRDTEEKQEEG